MRNRAPQLLPIFRSQRQAMVLATLLFRPERELTMSELARHLGVPISSIQRDVQDLVQAEILRSRTVGRARLLSGNGESRLVRPLTDLLAVTYGPLTVVGEEFDGIADVDLVLIYGSWAARYRGEPGPPPQDLDVLVVGAPARTTVYDAAERASARLGIPVSPTICSRQRWDEAADGLIQQIRTSPSVAVVDRQGAT